MQQLTNTREPHETAYVKCEWNIKIYLFFCCLLVEKNSFKCIVTIVGRGGEGEGREWSAGGRRQYRAGQAGSVPALSHPSHDTPPLTQHFSHTHSPVRLQQKN